MHQAAAGGSKVPPAHPLRIQTELRVRTALMSRTGVTSRKDTKPPAPLSIPKFHLSSAARGLIPAPSISGGPTEGRSLERVLQLSPGAFHPESFKALGKPLGRAAGAIGDRGESETRLPPSPGGQSCH